MNQHFNNRLKKHLTTLKKEGTYKAYKHLSSPIAARSMVTEYKEHKKPVTILSSNDYLGLANHPTVLKGAQNALNTYGAGTASVRFICGTMVIHQELEKTLATFHKTEDALTFSSCWAANTGLFQTICNPGDVLLSDALNHASIIDGGRLLQKGVHKEVYRHSDMLHLEELLKKHKNAPTCFIVTDGVFSMEGDIANLPKIVALAKKYNAVLIVDDSHGVGVMGPTGRGVAEHFNLEAEVDIFTGTLGKALGGAAGGYIAAPTHVVETLKQAARPHIFSNAISPPTAGSALAALRYIINTPEDVQALQQKAQNFRMALKNIGFAPLQGESAIIPIIIGKTAEAIAFSEALFKEGIFVTGFGFPVVPEGEARIRVQISNALTTTDLKKALSTLEKIAKKLKIL